MTTGSFPIRWAAAFLPVHRLGRLCGEGAAARRGLWVSLLVVMLSIGWAATAQADRIPIATFEIEPELPGSSTSSRPSTTSPGACRDHRRPRTDLRRCLAELLRRHRSGRAAWDVSMARPHRALPVAVARCPSVPAGPARSLQYDYWLGDEPVRAAWLFVVFALDAGTRQRLSGRAASCSTVSWRSTAGSADSPCVRTGVLRTGSRTGHVAAARALAWCGLAQSPVSASAEPVRTVSPPPQSTPQRRRHESRRTCSPSERSWCWARCWSPSAPASRPDPDDLRGVARARCRLTSTCVSPGTGFGAASGSRTKSPSAPASGDADPVATVTSVANARFRRHASGALSPSLGAAAAWAWVVPAVTLRNTLRPADESLPPRVGNRRRSRARPCHVGGAGDDPRRRVISLTGNVSFDAASNRAAVRHAGSRSTRP